VPETMLVDPDFAAELHGELARLKMARAMNPKHGTRAGPVNCADDCAVCCAEKSLDSIIDRIPRRLPIGPQDHR
jgi:hypothetical protein